MRLTDVPFDMPYFEKWEQMTCTWLMNIPDDIVEVVINKTLTGMAKVVIESRLACNLDQIITNIWVCLCPEQVEVEWRSSIR